MMKNARRLGVPLGFAVLIGSSVVAQSGTTPPDPNDPPPLLVIYREEVKPGKAAAHTANEQAWAAALTKGQAPIQWLGMTTIAGPSEAWFLSRYDSYAQFQKTEDAMEASATLASEQDRFSTQDGDLLNRTSTIIARYQPALSYQPRVEIAKMRYMQVDVVEVRPGHGADFTETWRSIVAAHEKAKMNEHWAVYAVQSGMPTGTFLFLYAHTSLDALDAVQPMHTGDEYRDAVGESGRARQNAIMRDAVAVQQTLLFGFKPRMSLLSKEFINQDPAFWTPKPTVSAPARKPADKE